MVIRAARALVCTALFVLLSGPDRPRPPAQQAAPPVFSWKSRYADALEAARRHRLLVAVYFRPVVGIEPRPLRFASKTKNLGQLVSGVRVAAAEVIELQERFQVKHLPALVVLDGRERVLMHWQENIPADVWARVARRFRQLEEHWSGQKKDIEAARALFDSGEPGPAYRKLRPVLRSRWSPPHVSAGAKELQARMIEAGEERILLILAGDGLVEDAQLEEGLHGLFYEPMPPELEEALDRELRRLERTTIGGRTEG